MNVLPISLCLSTGAMYSFKLPIHKFYLDILYANVGKWIGHGNFLP